MQSDLNGQNEKDCRFCCRAAMASTYKMEVVAESSEAQHIYEDMEVLKNRNKIDLKPDEEECNAVSYTHLTLPTKA